ncbi:MAG: EFR1 family ferrodoxin [Firmicutes bacterium]|nr:EFR1 family ferrodoxin [Bacillota bacterium]
MNKVLIHYFSGTGNSAAVAELAAGELQQSGFEPTLRSITEGRLPYSSTYNYHVFIFPIYALSLPAIMKKYLRRLPPGRGTKTMVLAVCAGYEGRALYGAARILKRRGYDVQLSDTIICPGNFTQITNPSPAGEQDRIRACAAINAKAATSRFLAGKISKRTCGFLSRLWTGALGFLFTVFGRRFLGKSYVADEACVQCGKCARACPTGALRLVKRPRWNYKCQACQRCINLCPQRAIQTSCARPVVFLGTMALSYYGVARLAAAPFMPVFDPAVEVILFVFAWLIGHLVLVYLADKILFVLELIPGIRKLLGFSFTKHYRRYLAPHFKV